MQFAWLDRFGERWLLLNGNLKYPARSWATSELALAELKEEGWIIRPLIRRIRRRSTKKRIMGYAMVRTIH